MFARSNCSQGPKAPWVVEIPATAIYPSDPREDGREIWPVSLQWGRGRESGPITVELIQVCWSHQLTLLHLSIITQGWQTFANHKTMTNETIIKRYGINSSILLWRYGGLFCRLERNCNLYITLPRDKQGWQKISAGFCQTLYQIPFVQYLQLFFFFLIEIDVSVKVIQSWNLKFATDEYFILWEEHAGREQFGNLTKEMCSIWSLIFSHREVKTQEVFMRIQQRLLCRLQRFTPTRSSIFTFKERQWKGFVGQVWCFKNIYENNVTLKKKKAVQSPQQFFNLGYF